MKFYKKANTGIIIKFKYKKLIIPVFKGSTRIAIPLFKRIVIKIPNILNYRMFLYGILGNLQERKWYKITKHKKLCPVYFSLAGLINIMPYCYELSDKEFKSLDYNKFIQYGNSLFPVENKKCSFKKLNDKIIIVDYGN